LGGLETQRHTIIFNFVPKGDGTGVASLKPGDHNSKRPPLYFEQTMKSIDNTRGLFLAFEGVDGAG